MTEHIDRQEIRELTEQIGHHEEFFDTVLVNIYHPGKPSEALKTLRKLAELHPGRDT